MPSYTHTCECPGISRDHYGPGALFPWVVPLTTPCSESRPSPNSHCGSRGRFRLPILCHLLSCKCKRSEATWCVLYVCEDEHFLEFLRRCDAAIPVILSLFRIVNWSDKIYCLAFKPNFYGATGLPTIRTYGEIPRFMKENEYYIDLENRALFLTVTNQR